MAAPSQGLSRHEPLMNLSDFAARCGWPPRESIVRARLSELGMLVTCSRCKGTGLFERNPLDRTCYGCAGRKLKLPPLTARLAGTVRECQDRGDLRDYFRRLSELREANASATVVLPAQEVLAFHSKMR